MFDWRKVTQTMLKTDVSVKALVGDKIYPVVCQKDEGFPRIVIREEANETSTYSDGKSWGPKISLRLWIWAKTYDEWIAVMDAADVAMVSDGWARKSVSEDDYVPAASVYEKSILYSKAAVQRK